MILRRTRLGLLAAPQLRDAASVRAVAAAMGAELGWSRRQVKREAEAWPAAAAEAGHRPRRLTRRVAAITCRPMNKTELESKHLAELHSLAADADVPATACCAARS